jgi:hypothetical protein
LIFVEKMIFSLYKFEFLVCRTVPLLHWMPFNKMTLINIQVSQFKLTIFDIGFKSFAPIGFCFEFEFWNLVLKGKSLRTMHSKDEIIHGKHFFMRKAILIKPLCFSCIRQKLGW